MCNTEHKLFFVHSLKMKVFPFLICTHSAALLLCAALDSVSYKTLCLCSHLYRQVVQSSLIFSTVICHFQSVSSCELSFCQNCYLIVGVKNWGASKLMVPGLIAALTGS